MKQDKRPLFTIITTFTALLLYSGTAAAYLDPGTGSILVQIILGGIAGIAVAGKLFWHQIKSFFRFTDKDVDKLDD